MIFFPVSENWRGTQGDKQCRHHTWQPDRYRALYLSCIWTSPFRVLGRVMPFFVLLWI